MAMLTYPLPYIIIPHSLIAHKWGVIFFELNLSKCIKMVKTAEAINATTNTQIVVDGRPNPNRIESALMN